MYALRVATADDAESYRAHAIAIVGEVPRTAPLAIDEVRSVDEMRAFLTGSHAILAIDNDAILGAISLTRPSPRRAFAHVRSLGMSVRADARRRGIGRALLGAALTWADAHGITRVDLNVFADNAGAIALYEACGFQHEGRRRRAIRFADGTYVDDLMMARTR